MVLASDRLISLDFLEKTQCLPLYRYTADGEQVCNITDWGIRQFNDHYREEWGNVFEELAGPEGITAEDIFAYTHAVLHDPVYRHDYRVDLLREFPRLPLYPDFHHWAEMGRKLLDLHIGFESAEPYPLERHDREGVDPKRAILRADKSGEAITLDERTTLAGIPERAWEYQLGSRSARAESCATGPTLPISTKLRPKRNARRGGQSSRPRGTARSPCSVSKARSSGRVTLPRPANGPEYVTPSPRQRN